jgi:energy-coupling factor transporter transmembrane protein EcfT
MMAIKHYLDKNSEQLFVLLILVSVVCVNYFIPYKLIFLNFYFIVILFGTFYLELRKAVLGGVLSALLVIIHVFYFPSSFMPAFTTLDLWMNILAWCSFLILSGAMVGKLTNRLKTNMERFKDANRDLEAQNEKLEKSVKNLAKNQQHLLLLLDDNKTSRFLGDPDVTQ